MRRTFAVLCMALLILASAGALADEDYLVVVDGPESEVNRDGLHPYYFLHYFYLDVLLRLGLLDRFSLEEKAVMARRLFLNLSAEHPVRLIVKDYEPGKDLQIAYRIMEKEKAGERALMMFTNYHGEKRRLIGEEEWREAYARLYHLRHARMVPGEYLFSREREVETKGDGNNLADLYLFDDSVENDARIEPLLTEYIAREAEPAKRYIGLLTFAQYHMVRGDFVRAEDCLDRALAVWREEILERKDHWWLPYLITHEEYQVLSSYWK